MSLFWRFSIKCLKSFKVIAQIITNFTLLFLWYMSDIVIKWSGPYLPILIWILNCHLPCGINVHQKNTFQSKDFNVLVPTYITKQNWKRNFKFSVGLKNLRRKLCALVEFEMFHASGFWNPLDWSVCTDFFVHAIWRNLPYLQ